MPYAIVTRVRYKLDGAPGEQEFRGTHEERSAEMAAWMQAMIDQHGAAFEYGMGFATAREWYPEERE